MKRFLTRMFRGVVWVLAVVALLQVVVGFAGLPRFVTDPFTGRGEEPPDGPPRYIVVLGGGGIPSESGLIRTYYGAEIAMTNPTAVVVVSLPSEGDFATNSVGRMRRELMMRGVKAERIQMEWTAVNTHEQANNIAKLLGPQALTANVRIVTSPWHVGRSLGCFRKAGFTKVSGMSAVNTDVEADVGGGGMWRYIFWANLTATVECAREACALLAYKLRGWA